MSTFLIEEMTDLCSSPNEATEPALSSKLVLSKIPLPPNKLHIVHGSRVRTDQSGKHTRRN